ncbi:MAG: hypothetical protein ACTSQF_08365 [Candidatus Heimdallarchaeaceae archaeon]
MKLILSNWLGFEIDSSEFCASIETQDVAKLVKAFKESPYIVEDLRFAGFSKFFDTLVSAKNNHRRKFDKIYAKFEDPKMWTHIAIKEVLKYFQHQISLKTGIDYESLKNSDEWRRFQPDLNFEDMIKIAIVTKALIKEFPKYAPRLDECYYTFYRKDSHPDDSAGIYKISLTGNPLKYEQNWNETDKWAKVLESLRRKAYFKWTEHEI